MPRHFETRLVPYTAAQMFDLVADVAQYPAFLPWCQKAEVTRTSDTTFTATLWVGHKALNDRFTSRVLLAPHRAITVTYAGGPLSRLENEWTFTDTPDGGCEMTFLVDFRFRSPLLGALMDAFFSKAFLRMAEAFEARAKALYGIMEEPKS